MTTVFRNARVFDGHRYIGDAGDVTVDEGVIVSVGREGPERAKGAEVVDAEGGLLAPGFVDAHVHAVQGGLERIRCDLTGIPADQDAYLRAIGTYAADRPDEDWILGGGWAMAAFPGGTPTAASLDSAVADRPVFLPNRDHHGAWVNTMALRLAGITRDTPDPAHGRVERDASGNPTGTLHESAMALVARHLPPTTDRELYAGLLAGQEYLLSLGVTSWQDAIVGAYSGMADNGPTYAAAASAGDLRASVVGALWWNRNRGAEQIEDLVRRRAELSHGRFVASAVKIMQDGVAENGTAAMLEPYLDRCGHSTDNAGMSFVSPELLKGYVAELDRLGFQVHFHGLGDRSVREALDALEGTDPAHRHHIAHLQLVHRDDVGRFAVLGVSANIQALWACYDDQMVDLTLPLLSARPCRSPVPVRRAVGGGGERRRRQRLARLHSRPAPGHPRRGQPHRARARWTRRHRAVPTGAGAEPGGRDDCLYPRIGLDQRARQGRRHRPRQRRRPGRARPGPVRRPDPDRCCHGRVDLDRRSGCLPRLTSYSHSMVPGGLLVMSTVTRLISRTSLVIRVEIRSSTSYGTRAQSAVIASSEVTGRSTTGWP